MFKENGMFNVPVGINEHENLSKEKSTEELKAELLEYQKRMEEIVAELARREQGSVQESSDEELLHTQVAEMREAFSDENEGRAEEFDNQRSEELEEKITGDDFKKRTLEYLENAGVVKYKAGQVFFDMGIFESREFSEDLFKLFLGRKDGRDFKGNKKLVKEMFSDIKIHNLSAGGNKEKEYENLEQIKYDLYLEKIKNMFLDDLRKEGVLKEIEGVKIFDFDKFSQYKFKKNFGYIDNRAISANFSCIFDFLKDQELVSLQDYQRARENNTEIKTKPLFNVPESIEEAFSEKGIKNKEYYLDLWDIGKSSQVEKRMHWEVHKTIQAKNSEEINTRELYIATKIFRDFNGKRENGVLMVDDPEKGKRVKITYDWFVKYLKNMAGLEEGIHRFMQKNCQNLLDRGLLVYRDFEVQTTREAGRIIRKEWKPVEGKKFEVSQNYTKYYIAQKGYFIQDERKIPTQNIKVVLLDNKTLGVVSKVNNAEKLEYTIDMLNSEEMKEKKYVNSEERNNRIDKFSLSSVIMKKAGESEEEYLDRASKVSEYNHVKDVSENLLNECQVSIHNLSWREQVWLSVAEHELRLQNKYDEFLDFVREYKLEGLRTFLSCEQDLDNAQELINFSKKENPEIVEKIIKSYAQIQEKARLLEEAMHSQEYLENKNASQAVKEKLRNNLYDAFISRATDILNTAFVISEKGEAKANFYNGKEISMSKLDEVHEALSVYEDFLEKLRGFFREDGQYKFTHQETIDKDEMKIYQFSVVDNSADEKSYCSVSIRPEGNNDFLEDYEYDGEARINFLFNPENISANINDKSRREATTFRLDRECMIFNKKGELIGKDFAQKNGKVSLDFGSIYEDAGRENSVLGRAMSLGNFYNSQKKNKNPEYYHNKEAFYTELGEADAFRQIAKLVEEYIKKKYLENE